MYTLLLIKLILFLSLLSHFFDYQLHLLFSEVCRKFLYKRKTLQHFFVTFRILHSFMRHSSILTCPKNLFAHLFLVTNAESPFLSPKFGNERRITISLAQIILIVTETYLYETFFSGKFADFVYTLTSQVIDASTYNINRDLFHSIFVSLWDTKKLISCFLKINFLYLCAIQNCNFAGFPGNQGNFVNEQ